MRGVGKNGRVPSAGAGSQQVVNRAAVNVSVKTRRDRRIIRAGGPMASNADADLDDIEDGDLKRKKWSGKKIVMIAVPVLVLLIGGGVAATMLMGGGEHKSEEQAEEEDPEAAKIVYVDLPDLLVNLKSPDRKSSFLKLSISLEVKGQKQADEIKEKMPRVIDGFQVYLRELRIDDLSGSAGMFRLKEELLRRVNTSLAPLKVNDVLFKEMLVQ